MDKLQMMRTFVTVAEEEGFAPAARKLSMSPPAVTRAVSHLEDSLGVKLLDRTTRYVRVTDAGLRYLEDCKKILEQVLNADESARGINQEPQGILTVTAPVMFGRMFVMPGITEFLSRYPKTKINAVFVDRVVNLLEEGIDLSIRIGNLPDSSMRALRVGSVRQVLCASPEYIEAHGKPESPDDLVNHQLIAASSGGFKQDWQFMIDEKKESLKLSPRLSVSNNDAAKSAAQQGFGICRLLSYQIAPELENNQLKIVLEDYECEPFPVNIVHREGRLASTKVRAFIDLLADILKSNSIIN